MQEVVASAREQSLGIMLARTSARFPTRDAIIFEGNRWTYAEFDQTATDLARSLVEMAIRPGDRVAVLARNSAWFICLRFAVARAGGIFVPINFMLTATEVAYILGNSGASVLFTDAATSETAMQAAHEVGMDKILGLESPLARQAGNTTAVMLAYRGRSSQIVLPAVTADSPAQILYTSGTESRPKGAVLSHAAILWQVEGAIHACDWRSDAIVINALPLFHCAQLDGFMAPALAVGATNVILADANPDRIAAAARQHQATSLFCPPTVWIDLLRHNVTADGALTTLTHGYYGASIMPQEVLKEIDETLPGLRLWNCYGQTETACIATVLQPEDQLRKLGSAGRPTLHVQTRVVDDDMHDVAPGEMGEVVHRSPQLMSGYWDAPHLTVEAFAGGWFHSGDLATIDDEGFLTIVDRKKDIIKSGGENVSSREVEDVLYEYGPVSAAAVIGLPDPRWVETVVAVIVLRNGQVATEQDILAHCRARLASFKTPKRVVLTDTLPRNASGKILKRALREGLVAMESAVTAG